MCIQPNSPDTRSATSLLVSADGATHCSSPAGLQLSLFGREAVHVSHSARPGSKRDKPTTDTCGPTSPGSSASVALQSSLENRLRRQLDSVGSTKYAQTWKVKVTPSGRRYLAHTVSARRISASGCTGWLTPCKQDGPNGGPSQGVDRLPGAVATAGWMTPRTPTGGPSSNMNPAHMHKLEEEVTLCGWAMPTGRDYKDGASNLENVPINGLLGRQVSLSRAPTGNKGGYRLNPHFSRWLMGFPPAWCDCAATAMQSFPKQRRSSSRQQSA